MNCAYPKRQIDAFEAKGSLETDTTIGRLKGEFLKRARHNLETSNLLYKVSLHNKMKNMLNLRVG